MALLSFVDSTPRAYRLKASNAAPPISTFAGAIPIFAEYEQDLCQVTLHHKLGQIGWGYDEIMAAVLNPATLTDCVYLSDWRQVALLPALIAA